MSYVDNYGKVFGHTWDQQAAALKALAAAGVTATDLLTAAQKVKNNAYESKLPRPLTFVEVGTSILNHDDTDAIAATNGYFNFQGIFNWANMYLGQRMRRLGNVAVSGSTSADALASQVAAAIALAPKWVLMDAIVNDLGNVSLATTKANLLAIWAAFRAADIRVCQLTAFPSGNYSVGAAADCYAINRWLRDQAQAGLIVLADAGRLILDPSLTKAQPRTALIADSLVHPNAWGAMLAGHAVADAMAPYVAHLPVFTYEGNGDTTSFLTNGTMIGSAGTVTTGGAANQNANAGPHALATSWSVNGNGANYSALLSKVAATDGSTDEWQQIVVAAGSPQLYQLLSIVPASIAVGATFYGQVQYETDADAISGCTNMQIVIENQSGTAIGRSMFRTGGDGVVTNVDLPRRSGIMRTPNVVVPVGATNLNFFIRISGTGTFRFRRAELRAGTGA